MHYIIIVYMSNDLYFMIIIYCILINYDTYLMYYHYYY